MKNCYVLVALVILSCTRAAENVKGPLSPNSRIEELIANLEDSQNKEIMVVAHRGDWRNAPENSLQAIEFCIDMGVDIVELDVQETKDGQLVLMHDEAIDRTTNGSGLLKDWTWDSLRTLNLKDGSGVVTAHKVPTLEEALIKAKGRILVNLDKGYPIFEKCYEVAKKTRTTNQIIIKGDKRYDEVVSEFNRYEEEVYFMPIVRLYHKGSSKMVEEYLSAAPPVAFEFTVPQDTFALIERFDEIRDSGTSIWVNALWPRHNAGHDDEKAVEDPNIYDWYVARHVDIIQTDRPQLLLKYLRERGLHD